RRGRAVAHDRAGPGSPLETRCIDPDARAEQRAVVDATHRAVAVSEPAIRRRDIEPHSAAQARATSHPRLPHRCTGFDSPRASDQRTGSLSIRKPFRRRARARILSLISLPLTVCSRLSFGLFRVALQLTPWGVPLDVVREPPSR